MKTVYRIAILDAQNRMVNKTIAVAAPKGLWDAVQAVQKELGVTNDPNNTQVMATIDLEVA